MDVLFLMEFKGDEKVLDSKQASSILFKTHAKGICPILIRPFSCIINIFLTTGIGDLKLNKSGIEKKLEVEQYKFSLLNKKFADDVQNEQRKYEVGLGQRKDFFRFCFTR